jgi:Xaa-Pro dipeptidase
MDQTRLGRVQSALSEAGLAGLIVRLTENVLYLTGFWPAAGFSLAVVPAQGEPALIVPATEWENSSVSWVREIWPYSPGRLDRLSSLYDEMTPAITTILQERGLAAGSIGYEGSFELVASSHWAGETRVPAEPLTRWLHTVAPQLNLQDATGLLQRCREVKSAQEIEQISLACQAAELGLAAAKSALRPGMTEVELASLIESTIHTAGTGFKGIERVRGYATVMSGPLSEFAQRHFCVSSARAFESGDLVLIELGTCADGYWSDLTRVFTVGQPDPRQTDIHAIVLQAQQAAIEKMRPDVPVGAVYQAAYQVIEAAGYGAYFPHILGHGIGLAWHEPPFLHPLSDHILQPGEVYTIEPGIYLPGWGGIRLEDVVVVTESGGRLLSSFSPDL